MPKPDAAPAAWESYRAQVRHDQNLSENGDYSLSIAAALMFCITVYFVWHFNARVRAYIEYSTGD